MTSRSFGAAGDLTDMGGLLMEGRAAAGDRFPHVGLLAWTWFLIDRHLRPDRHIRLWHDGSRLAAYALVFEDPAFDWQVLPSHEWQGIEDEARAWADGLVDALRTEDPARWEGPLVAVAQEGDEARIQFLRRSGFESRPESGEIDFVRPLDVPLPAAPLPDGWRVRGLRPGEEAARAAAHRAVWQPWTVGNVDEADYRALGNVPGYRRSLDLVTVAPDGTIGAYANSWLDPVNRVGDFGPVGAPPEHRRRGLTRAVLCEGLRRLRAAGMQRACVSTGIDNTAARGLYESVGFAPAGRHVEFAEPPTPRSAGRGPAQ